MALFAEVPDQIMILFDPVVIFTPARNPRATFPHPLVTISRALAPRAVFLWPDTELLSADNPSHTLFVPRK